jgi:hypothetical protein
MQTSSMENLELTIAVGAAVIIYRHVEITVWQKDLDSPFSFEFSLDGKTTRRRIKNQVASYRRSSRSHSS